MKDGLKNLIKQPISSFDQNKELSDSEESVENYKDVDSDKEEEIIVKEVKQEKPKENPYYDNMKRNPLYAKGDKALLWELNYL